jgi:transcription elongation GreA/GreB family factor
MKKFIMILAGFAMLGAAVVGWLNKTDFEKVNAELASLKSDVTEVTSKLGEAEDKRDDAEEKETQAKDTRNQAAAAVAESEQKLKVVQRSLEEVTGNLKKAEIEKKEIDLAIRKVFPDGNIKSSQDLQMTLTMLKDTLTESQNKKTELNTQLGSAAQAKQVQVSKVKEEENYQVQRAQRLALNGLVATVIAVNKEWGFVMINAGRSHGVAPDASLLVKRGNSRIARLRIVNLEDMVVVADIVDESIVSGIEVQPGDKVIFENAQ